MNCHARPATSQSETAKKSTLWSGGEEKERLLGAWANLGKELVKLQAIRNEGTKIWR